MEKKLAGLEPKAVFEYFEEIANVPHGSWNCGPISQYLVDFADAHGLRSIRDKSNNVIIFKDGSAGYEDHPPMILQGHMDMVCQKDEGVNINFETDPLDLVVEGDLVFARGTTLGADDGIAMALFLAVLADDTIAHPPLEVVFTADEEVGLIGANAIDVSMLKGRKMLNVDTFREGTFTAGSAGGAYVTAKMPVQRESYKAEQLLLKIDGLRGGHSASVVQLNYGNADKAMGQLLSSLGAVRLIELAGGTAGNAVPRTCQAVIAAEDMDMAQVEKACKTLCQQLQTENKEAAATVTFTLLPAEETQALTEADSKRIANLICSLPNGVQAWEPAFEGLPQTSLNLGIMELKEELELLIYPRSSINAERQALQDKLKAIIEAHGAVYGQYGVFSAWEYREESPFRDAMCKLYKDMYGKDPIVRVVHAGLEGGAFADQLPGLECISTGPQAHDVHTSRERMEIASMGRFWEYLTALLKSM